ncbi:hypothetical protein VKT23_018054 [Stygiomarasmius scandens]|uniref:Hydrophobin n=1 Tax=Marasmiellus scandens TaxID=2682957 RepID=A0ABR1IQB5_9AGAR
MFSRLSTLIVAITAASLAVAIPTEQPSGGQCNTGPVQCCNSVQSSNTPSVAKLLGTLGAVVQGVDVPIGLTCTPVSVIGVGGNSCSTQPVCCENNNFNGVIAVGCTPVNVNL